MLRVRWRSRPKKGQIGHIDQNPTNADESCLVYLCLEHHDEYDSKTSQIKGITESELRIYKDRLIAAITAGGHPRRALNYATSERSLHTPRRNTQLRWSSTH